MQSGARDEAIAVARRAVADARTCLPAHGFLASLLLRLGRTDEAAALIAHAAELGTGSADAYDGLAFVAMALGQHERANELYRRTTEIAPRDPRFWHNLACSERSLGHLVEAERACDKAIAADGGHYASYLLRSELRIQSAEANHVEQLAALLKRQESEHRAQVLLGYALAKELDDLGRFDEAFHWFERAARARRSRMAYEVAIDERKMTRIHEVFSRDLLTKVVPDPSGVDSSRYVFILGLPRSGTTLLERILTGLDGARSNGETDNFSQALLGAARGEGDVFARSAAADPAAVAQRYAHLAEPGVAARRIVEKMPLNYLYIGAIIRALPQATILLVRRSPLDSCFAMYRTLFAAGYPFSYDLKELGRYYGAYQRLMEHWRAALGDRVREIVYEDLVCEPQRTGALAAGWCGLIWDDAAVDIQSNKSVSLTASAAQVRRPIYGSSSGRWRHYRTHLEPLIAALGAEGVAMPS